MCMAFVDRNIMRLGCFELLHFHRDRDAVRRLEDREDHGAESREAPPCGWFLRGIGGCHEPLHSFGVRYSGQHDAYDHRGHYGRRFPQANERGPLGCRGDYCLGVDHHDPVFGSDLRCFLPCCNVFYEVAFLPAISYLDDRQGRSDSR